MTKFEEDRPQPRTEALAIDEITRDEAMQSRPINYATVHEYEEAMSGGDVFPPLLVMHDGKTFWLFDGFHRLVAAKNCGLKSISCEIRKGTKREAILASVGVNATHGLRRTNEDKRRAVRKLLDDPEWTRLPDREIARQAHVSNTFVGQMRADLVAANLPVNVDSEKSRTRTMALPTRNTP